MTGLIKSLAGLERAGKFVEDALLVLILGAMILLAAGQIVMRNFFDFGFIWTDELLRLLVFWLAVGGAIAASRSDKHITIDVLRRFLPDRAVDGVTVVTHGFTAAVCGVVAWYGYQFVVTSREFEDVLLGGVPAWPLQAILPAGFGLIAWRYVVFAVRAGVRFLRPGGER